MEKALAIAPHAALPWLTYSPWMTLPALARPNLFGVD